MTARRLFLGGFAPLLLLTACGQVRESDAGAGSFQTQREEPASAETDCFREDVITIGEDAYTIRRIGVDSDFYDCPLLDTVEVYRKGDFSAPMQIFMDFTYDADPPLDGELLIEDLNFDGWPDLRIFSYQARIGSGWFYWLWDPEAEAFTLHQEMEDLYTPVVEQAEQTIYSSQLYGPGGFRFSAHQWEDGALVEARRFSVEWEGDRLMDRWYVRRDGELCLEKEWYVDWETYGDKMVVPEAEAYWDLAIPKSDRIFTS